MNTKEKRKIEEFEESKKVGLKEYTKTYTFDNGRVITMVALVYKQKVDNIVREDLLLFNNENDKKIGEACVHVNKKRLVKKLRIGYSMLHPEDEYDFNFGKELAHTRAITHPICHMESHFTGEFNQDTVLSIMDVKAKYLNEKADKAD